MTIRDQSCRRCPLWQTARSIGIMGDGQPGGILFVGIGPGFDEDRLGEPFVGRSGVRLRLLAGKLSVPVAYTNIVGCLPPDNKPDKECREACWNKWDRLEAYQPRVIVTLGEIALRVLTKQAKLKVGQSRGRTFEYQGIPIVATHHPARSLREKTNRTFDEIKHDLVRAERIAKGEKDAVVQFLPFDTWPESLIIDIETNSELRPWSGEIIRIGLGDPTSPERAFLVDSKWRADRHISHRVHDQSMLKPKQIWGWSFSFDAQWLPDWVFDDDVEWIDGMLLHGLLYPDAPARSLKVVGPAITGVPYLKTLADGLEGDDLDDYLRLDLYQTGKCIHKFLDEIVGTPMEKLYPWVMRLAKVCAKAQKYGIKINRETARCMALDLRERQSKLVERMDHIGKLCEVNLKWKSRGFTYSRSTKAVEELIFNRLGLPMSRTKKGNPCLDKKARLRMQTRDHSGFLEAYGEFLNLQKTVQSYVKPFVDNSENWMDPDDVAHPSALLFPVESSEESGQGSIEGGAVTGRIVWKDPPLQVFPEEVHHIFIARPGNRICVVDLSQIEPRVMAWLAQEHDLLEGFREGRDFYLMVMSKALGVPEGEVTKELRAVGKTVVLSILYGVSLWTVVETFEVAGGMTITQDEANDFIDQFTAELPGLVRWKNDIVERIEQGLPIVTPAGRSRTFLGSDPEQVRMAINFEPQSFASDINHAMMMELAELPGIYPQFTRHDDILFEAEPFVNVESEVAKIYSCAQEIVANHFGVTGFDVPIKYTLKVGSTW